MIQFGNDKIKEIYYGSDEIKEVYYGSELVWTRLSYMILTDGTRIYFEVNNTPIANFCDTSPSIVINGVSYPKNTIKVIHFGTSYSGVTNIGDYFMHSCRSLTSVTLNFPSLRSIGNVFMPSCSSLTDITLNFHSLNSVGNNFLTRCSSLTNVTVTRETPPITGRSNFLLSASSLSSIYVPANSVNLYKTTAPWSYKSSLIKPFYSKPSYAVLVVGTRIGFEIDNTPIANFCNSNTTIVINGVSYTKSAIKEIHYGNSYSEVTEIPDYFLYNCSSLTNVTLDFPALNSVGNDFLYNCSSLTSVTLNFPALRYINNNFMNDCAYLTNVTLTAETPPIASSFFLHNTYSLSSIYVPANSVNLYKTTAPWSYKSSLIKAI